MVEPRLKETKIVVAKEAFSWDIVPQNNIYGEEAVCVELAPYQRNTQGTGMLSQPENNDRS